MGLELPDHLRTERIAPGTDYALTASAEACAALAERLGIPAVASVTCAFRFTPEPQGVFLAEGTLQARVTQICVVSDEAFESDIAETFRLRFVPAESISEEIDVDGDDEVPYEGNLLDLGEATAEQLALALPPWPRAPGAELPPEARDDSANPFAVLRALRKPQ
jgi:uncharacterized metal-binding protein YceD (DUF177 family)